MLIALRWASCALIVALVVLLTFKKDPAGLISRIRKPSKSGFEADPAITAGQETKRITGLSPSDQFLRSFDNQLLVEQEAGILRELEQMKITDPSQEQPVLVRSPTALQIVVNFERTYQLIFGSQIRALQALNENQPHGVPLKLLEPWYELGRLTATDFYATYSLEDWFGFLERMLLAKNQEGFGHITVRGRELLKYLIDVGYTHDKPA